MKPEGYPYITVTEGMSGWFAVKIWWNPDMGGFPEPYSTGSGRYQSVGDAEVEAAEWARIENLPFRLSEST